MRRLGSTLAITTVLIGAMASPAFAQRGFWSWLDRLSGPGPTKGWGVEVVLVCDDNRGGDKDGDKDKDKFSGQRALPGCFGRDAFKRGVVFVNIGLANLETGNNPSDGGGVGALILMPSVDLRLHRAVDVGVGMGVVRFRPVDDDGGFDAFWKPIFEIGRVTFRPLMVFSEKRHLSFLTVAGRLDAFGGFGANDFGPTAHEVGAELVPSVAIGIDIGTFIWN